MASSKSGEKQVTVGQCKAKTKARAQGNSDQFARHAALMSRELTPVCALALCFRHSLGKIAPVSLLLDWLVSAEAEVLGAPGC